MDRLKDFFDACRQGNLGLAKSLIGRGIDPHGRNDFALVLAASSGNVELLKALVEGHGFSVNAWDGAALHHAAASRQIESVQYLLGKGSDIQSQGNRALRWAVLRGHAEIARFLITQGADRHVITANHLTTACGNGHLALLMYLMEEFGLVPQDNRPLHHAVIEGHCEIVRYLVRKGKMDIREDNSHPLRHAAKVGNLRMLETVIELSANVHAKKDEALKLAAKGGHLDCVKYLVQHVRADINVLSKEDISGLSDKSVKAYLLGLTDAKVSRP